MHAVYFSGDIADDLTLSLSRCPKFLRVAVDRIGDLRPLTELDDTLLPDEGVLVYRRVGSSSDPGMYMLNMSQPSDEICRDKALWQAWCVAELKRKDG